jgi:hypothetical protein
MLKPLFSHEKAFLLEDVRGTVASPSSWGFENAGSFFTIKSVELDRIAAIDGAVANSCRSTPAAATGIPGGGPCRS